MRKSGYAILALSGGMGGTLNAFYATLRSPSRLSHFLGTSYWQALSTVPFSL